MSAHVVLSCDGHRHRQPCRGALHTRTVDVDAAWDEGTAAGWRLYALPTRAVCVLELCPSPGHDEEGPR